MQPRSIHRKHDVRMPEIKTYWDNDSRIYTLRDYHLHYWAFFTRYDETFLFSQQLPADSNVSLRDNPEESVHSQNLKKLIDGTVTEIGRAQKKIASLQHATILKDRDFNYKKQCGTIIVKLQDYPFIIKIFSETPKTFVQPFSKGIEPSFFYHMAGGMNRYLAGFTRPKNLHAIRKKINEDEKWRNMITTPRQWFWVPDNGTWFHVSGKNFGSHTQHHVKMPAVYAIVCDAIDSDTPLQVTNRKHRDIAF
jgi:hypothetical protein